MKVLRIIIVLVIIGVASVALYFWFASDKKSQPLQEFLNENAALYHRYKESTVSKLAHFAGGKNKNFEISNFIPQNSHLYKFVADGRAIVSWHLTRQNIPEPVVWVNVDDDYDIAADSVFSGKSLNDLLEVKINSGNVFIIHSNKLVALGNNGELMDFISKTCFVEVSIIHEMPFNKLKGSVKPAVSYIKSRIGKFNEIPITGNIYDLDYYVDDDRLLFNGTIDSFPIPCATRKSLEFNRMMPLSSIAGWQYAFHDNACLIRNLPNNVQSKLWDAEDRYQFKFTNILDAWFEGTLVYFYGYPEGTKETFAACKLKTDAAPFASGSRFFTDYRTISLEEDNPRQSFTIARMLPDQLGNIIFPNSPKNQELYVSQVHEWMYFSQNKTALLLILNELVNNKTTSGFSSHNDAAGSVYFRFPEIFKNIGVQSNKEEAEKENKNPACCVKAKFIPWESGIYFQGSVY